jgi:hypothetical protein
VLEFKNTLPTCFLPHAPTSVIVTKTSTTKDFPQCTRIKTNWNKNKIISNSRSHNTIIQTNLQNMQTKLYAKNGMIRNMKQN